jgi:hypothetical protein
MVNVEVWVVPATATGCGRNEHSGALGVTTGEIALHESVTLPVYPLSGVTVMPAVAPLPAWTELGDIGVVTVMVYSGVTASTVTFKDAIWVPEDALPVTVMV